MNVELLGQIFIRFIEFVHRVCEGRRLRRVEPKRTREF